MGINVDLTFDKAIDLLEITDISRISLEDIAALEKKAKKRWHPDRVFHLKDQTVIDEYTANFQNVERACQMVQSYLEGIYRAGEAFIQPTQRVYEEPEEIIRKNAPNIQDTLRNLWSTVKTKRYKLEVQEIVLSDGFKLRDLLQEDFKDDIAALSIVSFLYGLVVFGLLTVAIGSVIPPLGVVAGIAWALQELSCILVFIPLSRFWLPQGISDIALRFVNAGLLVYRWAADIAARSSSPWPFFFVNVPLFLGKLVKWTILFPLSEIAKLIVGDKVVGVVTQNVNYYAGMADWYIDDLLKKPPGEMTTEELFHLSDLYSDLKDAKYAPDVFVPSKTEERD